MMQILLVFSKLVAWLDVLAKFKYESFLLESRLNAAGFLTGKDIRGNLCQRIRRSVRKLFAWILWP